jgi:hypothetical protein
MPMRSGGVDTDIRTGRPVSPPKPEEQQAKVMRRFEMAVQDAWTISAELHENKVILRIFLEQFRNRLVELANDDPVCRALEAPIRAIRETLELKPIMAEREAIRRLGPQLARLVPKTEAAP